MNVLGIAFNSVALGTAWIATTAPTELTQIKDYGTVGIIAIALVGGQIAATRDMTKRLREIENQRFETMKANLKAMSDATAAISKLSRELSERPCQQVHRSSKLRDEDNH